MAIDTTDTATIHIFNKRGRGRPKVKLESAKELASMRQVKFKEDKRAAGFKQSTVWLSGDNVEAMKAYQEAEGLSRDAAINNLIEAGLKANN
jgi:hypothetical protein